MGPDSGNGPVAVIAVTTERPAVTPTEVQETGWNTVAKIVLVLVLFALLAMVRSLLDRRRRLRREKRSFSQPSPRG